MIAVAAAGRIFLRRAPTDMRKSFDGLSGIVRGELGPGVLTGYILLPGALGASAFSLWEDYSDALHASALACAQAVIARLREGIFWPPGSLAGGYQDDLAGLLLDDPANTINPPSVPWRVTP